LSHPQQSLTNPEISAAFLAQTPINISIGINHAKAPAHLRFCLRFKEVLYKGNSVGILVHLGKLLYQTGLDLVSIPVLQDIIKILILVNLAKIRCVQSVVPLRLEQHANNAKILIF